MTYNNLSRALHPHGLICRGGFHLLPDDPLSKGEGTVILIGNAGSALWSAFQASPEAAMGQSLADPLDSWTRRIVDDVAAGFGAQVLYPFDGPPYYPFQQWAMRADTVYVSPIGPLIHPDFGLWHAYRAALIFDMEMDVSERPKLASPCDGCSDKPCLTACPVGAFQPDFYDVPACVDHLDQAQVPACRTQGCLARHACPIGQAFAYEAPHAGFHMDHFVQSQRAG